MLINAAYLNATASQLVPFYLYNPSFISYGHYANNTRVKTASLTIASAPAARSGMTGFQAIRDLMQIESGTVRAVLCVQRLRSMHALYAHSYICALTAYANHETPKTMPAC